MARAVRLLSLILLHCSVVDAQTVHHVAADGSSAPIIDGAAFAAAVQAGLQGGLDDLRALLGRDATYVSAAITGTGATALHFAAAKGLTEMAQLLIAHGASLSAKTNGGATPLSMACSSVMLETAALLIEHGAGKEPSCGANALHAAVSLSKHAIVEKLLQGGASPNVADSDDGATPLHIAASTGDPSIASLLLQYGAAHAARYKTSGEQPLHIAAIKANVGVARLLVAAGASLEARSTSGQTPLHCAAIHGSTDVIDLLARSGAQVGSAWRLGATSLHEAASRGDLGSVLLLLSRGADAEHADAYGDPALMWAAARGHTEVAATLISQGRATLRPNRYGSTAFHAAAFGEHNGTLAFLCEQYEKCDDEMRTADAFGDTPGGLLEEMGRAGGASAAGDSSSGLGELELLRALQPPLPPSWVDAAARIASASERKLLVHAEPPSSVSPDVLVRELALVKQSLTFDRRVRSMLQSHPAAAMLNVRSVLAEGACAALRRAVDATPSLRNGTTDGMAEHTLHLEKGQLEELIGTATVANLWQLASTYRRQAAAASAADSSTRRSRSGADGNGGASSASAPRAMEIFIRRFSAHTRPWIKMHADVAAVTVNIALSNDDDYPGGRLLGVFDGAVRAIGRQSGDATVHPSSLLHGVSRMHGAATRYTLILFME